MYSKLYLEQAELALRLLPAVSSEKAFALKGGSAINFFYRDMPRLSVDIDLTYLPIEDWRTSTANIHAAFDRIVSACSLIDKRLRFRRSSGHRVTAMSGATEVKIETTPVMRGTVLPHRLLKTADSVEENFDVAEMQVVSFEDVYAGKMNAALDRQHPRDLYDIKVLYENEGIGDELFRVFLVYVCSSPRPIHEMLAPNLLPVEGPFLEQFRGMTDDVVERSELEAARARLFEDVRSRLAGDVAEFLLSVHDAEPRFDLIGLPEAENLPAVRWKLLNLRKFRSENPERHAEQRGLLENAFA